MNMDEMNELEIENSKLRNEKRRLEKRIRSLKAELEKMDELCLRLRKSDNRS